MGDCRRFLIFARTAIVTYMRFGWGIIGLPGGFASGALHDVLGLWGTMSVLFCHGAHVCRNLDVRYRIVSVDNTFESSFVTERHDALDFHPGAIILQSRGPKLA